jgi:type II secretory pathway pseudopilin PulG
MNSENNIKYSNISAFTLLELAIVITIIGLVIGGVLMGQDLIKAAQIRSTVSQVQSYENAALAFKNKYNCLPGDCNASTEFGFTSSCSALGSLCGNGTIGGRTNPAFDTSEYRIRESFDFWLQLSEAGLLEGRYPGATAAIAANNAAPGYAYPVSEISGQVGLLVSALGNNTGSTNYIRTSTGTTIAGSAFATNLFLPAINYMIDSKFDDGFPDSGKVLLVSVYEGWSMPNRENESLAREDGLYHSYGPAGANSPYCATDDDPSLYNVANVTPSFSYPGRPVTPNCSIAFQMNF